MTVGTADNGDGRERAFDFKMRARGIGRNTSKCSALPLTEGEHRRPEQPGDSVQAGEDAWAQYQALPGLYEALTNNQRDATWWINRRHLEMLREWQAAFIRKFDLRLKDTQYMGEPLIRIEPMNIKTIGAYRAGADGYALAGTLVFNEKRLGELPDFIKAAELLRLLLRAWRHQSGGDGSFDKPCRERMKAIGLVVTDEGAITIDERGGFRKELTSRGVDVPVASKFPAAKQKPRSTLRLWSCTCQKARVGTKEFFAACTICGHPFRMSDHEGKRLTTGSPEPPNWQI